jgi:hypothetical protein
MEKPGSPPALPPEEDRERAFAIGHDGKIDGIYRPQDQRRKWTSTDNARVELRAQTLKPEPEPPPRIRKPGPSRAQITALVIAGAAVFLLPLAGRWGYQLWTEHQARSIKPSGLIFIDSTPTGARLFIEGVEVGRTPYVAPNKFQPGSTVQARIVYPQAQDWTGTFPGGVDASFTAELQAQ